MLVLLNLYLTIYTNSSVGIAPLRTALKKVKDPYRQLIRLQLMQTLPEAEMFLQLQNMIAAFFNVRLVFFWVMLFVNYISSKLHYLILL